MSPGKRLDGVIKKGHRNTHFDQSKMSLRPKLRRFDNVFAKSLCRQGSDRVGFKSSFLKKVFLFSSSENLLQVSKKRMFGEKLFCENVSVA